MENAILALHLILALCLIVVVLVQRSEGGGLGIGGGGGGLVSRRSGANAMTKATWALAAGFICTSIALTIVAAANSAGVSVVDRLGTDSPADSAPASAGGTAGDDLLPPPASAQPETPPRAD